MARNRGDAALKRAREEARQAKQEAKREKRVARQSEDSSHGDINEQALLEKFARLSERYETNQINTETYESERHRIFVALGIESDE